MPKVHSFGVTNECVLESSLDLDQVDKFFIEVLTTVALHATQLISKKPQLTVARKQLQETLKKEKLKDIKWFLENLSLFPNTNLID